MSLLQLQNNLISDLDYLKVLKKAEEQKYLSKFEKINLKLELALIHFLMKSFQDLNRSRNPR